MKKQLQNEPDIVGLMAKMQEQLAALDKKLDTLISKSLPRPPQGMPASKPFQQPVGPHTQAQGSQDNRYRDRVMHKVICADCKKECEVPFKPSGDRPVYCKECFSRRKTSNTLKVSIDNKPKETPSVQVASNAAIHIQEPPAKEKKKPAAVKKSAGKKKLVSKKKKK